VTTQNDPATASARARLYQQSAKPGVVFNRRLSFYSGAPTTPRSFTGDQILGVASGGVGAALINGAGPPIVVPIPCDEPTIFTVQVVIGDDNVIVRVTYNNPLPDDIYVLFNSNGQSFGAVSSSETPPPPGEITILFPDNDVLPPGQYSLKIARAADPENCFSVRNGIFVVAATACPIETTEMSSPSGFPVVPPGPPGFPGGSFTIEIVGAGFLTGPLTITLTNNFPPFNVILPDSQLVIDDNNLTFDFTGTFVDGLYTVRVALTADPACFDEPPEGIALFFA